jgi:hypothetical protein
MTYRLNYRTPRTDRSRERIVAAELKRLERRRAIERRLERKRPEMLPE